MIVYVVHGDIIYDGEYYEGVFSTFEQAEHHAKNLPDYYDSVTVMESKLTIQHTKVTHGIFDEKNTNLNYGAESTVFSHQNLLSCATWTERYQTERIACTCFRQKICTLQKAGLSSIRRLLAIRETILT